MWFFLHLYQTITAGRAAKFRCIDKKRNNRFGINLNTMRPRQNGRHFPDDILKWIFLNENVWISIEISLKFVPKGQINNNPALVQIMAWHRPCDKPLSEPMMVSLLTHICVTRPQWVKSTFNVAFVPKIHLNVISTLWLSCCYAAC